MKEACGEGSLDFRRVRVGELWDGQIAYEGKGMGGGFHAHTGLDVSDGKEHRVHFSISGAGGEVRLVRGEDYTQKRVTIFCDL